MPGASAPTPISMRRRPSASTSRSTRRSRTPARARNRVAALPGCLISALPRPYPGSKIAGMAGPYRGLPGFKVAVSLTVRLVQAYMDGSVRRLGVMGSLRSGQESGEGTPMNHRDMNHRDMIAVASVLAALALAACSTTPSPSVDAGPGAAPAPEMPAKVRPSEIVGRWGYASFHDAKDRARTEANARGQCKQPFVIGQGPSGGVMMYIADSTQLQELRLKGSPGGRDYIGPAGETPGPQDREILSFDGRVMLLKFVDPEIDGRYGTGVFVRCAPKA